MTDPIHNRCYCSNQLDIKQNTSLRGWRCECCFKSYSKDISCYQCTNIEHCEFQERRGNIYTVCQSCYNSKYIDSGETNIGNHCLMVKKIKSAINIIKTEFQLSEESVRKYMNDVYRYFYTYWLLSIKESPFGSTNGYEMVLDEFMLLYNDILNVIKTKTDLVELELDKNVFVSVDDITSSSNTKLNKISLEFHIITENDKQDVKTQEFAEYHCDENTKCDECVQCKKIKFIMDQYQIYFINKYSTNEMNEEKEEEKEEQKDELEFIDVFMIGLNGYSIIDLINNYNHIKSNHVHFHASDTAYFTDCTNYDMDSCISTAVRTFRDISHRNSDINEHNNVLETYLQALDSRQRNIIQTTSKIHSFFNHSKQISTVNDNIEDTKEVNNLKKIRSMAYLQKKRRKDEETLKFNKFIIEIVQQQPTEQKIHSMHMDELFPILHKQKSKYAKVIDLCKFIEFEQYDSDAIINDISDDEDIKNEYPHSNLYNQSNKNPYLMKLIKTNFNLKNNDDDDIPKFIYGRYRFYHWRFMKKYTGYIATPKYKSLKDECLNNIIWPSSILVFTNRLDKAYSYTNSQYGKSLLAMNCGAQNNKYAIPPNYPITMSHIFVLLMYCNDTKLQYNYKKKGCREIVPNEELQSIQKRHTEISRWYRLFQEAIMFYGTKTQNKDIFYLGLNIRLLFNTYTPHFLCPFSTSVEFRIAHQFSEGVGIVLKLRQDSTSEASTYFNVEIFSNFAQERERLFAFTYGLRIMNIQYFHNNKIFSEEIYLRAFNLFSVIFSGYYFNFTMKKKELIEPALIKLIRVYNKNNGITNDTKSTENDESIHVYNQQLFYNLIDNYKATHNKTKTSLMIIKSEYLCLSSSLQQCLIRINDNQITLSPFLSAVTSIHNINIVNEYNWLIEFDEFESLKELRKGEWLQSKSTYTYNLPSSDNRNELEHDISKRLNWKIGSNVSIYNDATKTFESGIVESIYTDSNEEFFKVKNTKTNVITVGQRYSKHIKPCDVIKFNMEIRRCSSSNVKCSSFKINILESTSVNNLKFSIAIEEIGYFLNGWPAQTLKQGSSKIIRFFRNKLINNASKLTLKIAMFFY